MTISPAYSKICSHYLSGERPAFATTLVAILLRCYGAEVLNWDSWTIEKQIEDDFHVELDRKTHDKIQALITALTTTQVYQDAETFGHVVNSLNGKGITAYSGPPVPEDVAFACAELELADPQPEGLPRDRWSKSVRGYIRVVLDDAGLTIKPKSLAMAVERPGTIDKSTDATQFAGAWQSHQNQADEIDEIVSKRMDKLLEQMRAVGIPVQVKTSSVEALPEAVKSKTPIKLGNADSELERSDRLSPLHEALEAAYERQDLLDKKAEWVSAASKASHTEKHSDDFGGPEAYHKAEQEHSESPPADQYQKDFRCKPGKDGKSRCTVAMASPSKGTLHVTTLEDGRTVTLYKLNT